MLKVELVPAAGDKLVLKLSPPPPLADKQASLADNTAVVDSDGGNAVGIPSEPVSLKDGIDTGTGGTCTANTGTGNVPSEGEPAGSLAGVHFAGVSLDAVPEAFTVDDPAGAKAVGIPPESEPSPLKDGIDASGGNVAGESSPMKSFAKVGIVPADDGRITIVISESVSPSLLGAKACGVKNFKVAKSGTEDVLKKDPAAEKAPDAGAVDSDKAKAMFATHPPAVFWSKFTRPTGPPTAPTGAVKGALKKDIPAATSGAEACVDETGAIKNPALKPATEVATALKPAEAGGAPLPSIKEFPEEKKPATTAGDADWKEFPEETAAPAVIDGWKTPSPLRKIERKESPLAEKLAEESATKSAAAEESSATKSAAAEESDNKSAAAEESATKSAAAEESSATKSAAAEESATKSNGEPASLEDVTPSNGEPASLEDEMILLWPTGDDWRAAAELADKLNSQLGVAIDMVLLAGWVAVARVATESSQCMDTSCIGNRIHYIVSTLNSVWAGKITGMFLENDIQDLQEMLCVSDNSKAAALFVERVWQALGVLAQAFSLESPCYQDDETPASAKTFPEETASAGIDEWTTPSPLRKIERKGEPSLVDCSKNTTPMDPPTAPNGVTKSAPALTPAATGGAPLPSSEEFPVETPAPAGDADWTVSAKEFPGGISDRTTPSNPRRKKGRKGASAPIVRTKNTTPVGGKNRFGALLGTDGNEGILGGTGKVTGGSTPPTADSGATVDVETTTNTTPEGSAAGRFPWSKSYNLLRLFGILALICLGAAFAHSSCSATSALLSSQRYDSPWPTSPLATVAKPFTPASPNGFCEVGGNDTSSFAAIVSSDSAPANHPGGHEDGSSWGALMEAIDEVVGEPLHLIGEPPASVKDFYEKQPGGADLETVPAPDSRKLKKAAEILPREDVLAWEGAALLGAWPDATFRPTFSFPLNSKPTGAASRAADPITLEPTGAAPDAGLGSFEKTAGAAKIGDDPPADPTVNSVGASCGGGGAPVWRAEPPEPLNEICILENPIEAGEKAAKAHFTTDGASFTIAIIHSKIEAGETVIKVCKTERGAAAAVAWHAEPDHALTDELYKTDKPPANSPIETLSIDLPSPLHFPFMSGPSSSAPGRTRQRGQLLAALFLLLGACWCGMLLSVRRSSSGRLVRCRTGSRRGAWLLILAALLPLACAPSAHTSGSKIAEPHMATVSRQHGRKDGKRAVVSSFDVDLHAPAGTCVTRAVGDARASHKAFAPLGKPSQPPASCGLRNYPELIAGPKKGDDDKRLCSTMLETLRPSDVIVSVGSNNEFGFEEQMLACTKAHIAVFDCTVRHATNKPPTSRVSFHRFCVGTEDTAPTASTAQFRTWTSTAALALSAAKEAALLSGANSSDTDSSDPPRIAALKADIEGWEWAVLDQVLGSAATSLPRQIDIELHLRTHPWRNVSGFDGAGRLRGDSGLILKQLRARLERAGYAFIDRNDNPWCGHCSEVLFVRVQADD